ncbi:hypothetical protein Goklo_017731, partial [Gossypium klotzschianum]|nr:hypothetical protein [Gossypium klotzschianum]
MLLLCFLSHLNKSFKEALIYGRDKLSFEDLKGHLLSRDNLKNEFGLDSKESNEEDVDNANLVDESDDDFLLVSTSNNSKLTSEWILDSGLSFHMCPNREWFSIYSSVESGVVRMGMI